MYRFKDEVEGMMLTLLQGNKTAVFSQFKSHRRTFLRTPGHISNHFWGDQNQPLCFTASLTMIDDTDTLLV